MKAYFVRIPTEKELEGTGFIRSDYEGEEFEVWPENWLPIRLFITLQTQVIPGGGSGVIGFNYIPYFNRMDRMKLSEQEYEWLFNDIRAIESVALSEMNKKD